MPVAIGGSDATSDVTSAHCILGRFRSKREGRRRFLCARKHEKDCRCLRVGGRAERSPTPIVNKVRTRKGAEEEEDGGVGRGGGG